MSYVLLQCGKFLLKGFLVGEHGSQLVEHILQSLHHTCLQIIQFSLTNLLGKFSHNLGIASLIGTLMVVKVLAKFGHSGLNVIECTGSEATTSANVATTTTASKTLDLII